MCPDSVAPFLETDTDAVLLQDALGHAPARLISREPLGSGSVTGFEVEHGDAALLPAGGAQIWYVDTSRLAVDTETGLATGENPAHPDARLWQHPADPHLPALAPAAFGHSAKALLARLGMTATGAIEMVAYRPGRRAVLRIETATDDVWIKVVRSRRIDRLVRAHRSCAEAGLPVPALLGWSPDGLLVLGSAVGAPAADMFWDPDELLDRVDALRARIAVVRWYAPAKSIADRLDWYASHAGDSADARRIVVQVRDLLSRAPARPDVVVHGDLHFGQLFLDGDGISGLIDVDTFGVGPAAEDPAAFLAHAVASARLSSPDDRARVWRLADRALQRWDAEDVRAFTAVHLLGHAITARGNGDLAGATDLHAAALRIVSGQKASPET